MYQPQTRNIYSGLGEFDEMEDVIPLMPGEGTIVDDVYVPPAAVAPKKTQAQLVEDEARRQPGMIVRMPAQGCGTGYVVYSRLVDKLFCVPAPVAPPPVVSAPPPPDFRPPPREEEEPEFVVSGPQPTPGTSPVTSAPPPPPEPTDPFGSTQPVTVTNGAPANTPTTDPFYQCPPGTIGYALGTAAGRCVTEVDPFTRRGRWGAPVKVGDLPLSPRSGPPDPTGADGGAEVDRGTSWLGLLTAGLGLLAVMRGS